MPQIIITCTCYSYRGFGVSKLCIVSSVHIFSLLWYLQLWVSLMRYVICVSMSIKNNVGSVKYGECDIEQQSRLLLTIRKHLSSKRNRRCSSTQIRPKRYIVLRTENYNKTIILKYLIGQTTSNFHERHYPHFCY